MPVMTGGSGSVSPAPGELAAFAFLCLKQGLFPLLPNTVIRGPPDRGPRAGVSQAPVSACLHPGSPSL